MRLVARPPAVSALTLVIVFAPACAPDDLPSDETSGETEADGGGSTTADDAETGPTSGGDGDAGDGDGDGDGDGGITCADLAEGWNRGLVVDGIPRDFILALPAGAETGGPWPVVFNWHGLGDTAENFQQLVNGQVDGAWPFIAVTPEDTDYEITVPLLGTLPVDWEAFMVEQGSRELDLFDAVLACLDERYGVDWTHVHSMGFSLGGIVTDLVATSRGDVLASAATYSGGYWNNPDNLDALLGAQIDWPNHVTTNAYPQLILHGGPTDNFPIGPIAIQFDQYAISDTAWLNAKGHDVVLCDHGGGHTAPPPGMLPDRLIQFFADHPLGTTDSPYATGLPASFASYCAFSPKAP